MLHNGHEQREQKKKKLQGYLQSLGKVAVAYSGGVDSTYLLKSAQDVLGEQVLAVSVQAPSFPARELDAAQAFTQTHNIKHRIVVMDAEDMVPLLTNPLNRCYQCKKILLSKIQREMQKERILHLVEGSNLDDDQDFRPGRKAVKELGVLSPLREVGLTKEEIRQLSLAMELPTWNKPAFACLLSRFPYGMAITLKDIQRIDQAEQFLLDLGLEQVRVRCHGNLARIETPAAGFAFLLDVQQRERIQRTFQQWGFIYVTLDLLGYRTGSMNEELQSS